MNCDAQVHVIYLDCGGEIHRLWLDGFGVPVRTRELAHTFKTLKGATKALNAFFEKFDDEDAAGDFDLAFAGIVDANMDPPFSDFE